LNQIFDFLENEAQLMKLFANAHFTEDFIYFQLDCNYRRIISPSFHFYFKKNLLEHG